MVLINYTKSMELGNRVRELVKSKNIKSVAAEDLETWSCRKLL